MILLRLNDPFLSHSYWEYKAFHFQAEILFSADIIYQYGQISVSWTIFGGKTKPANNNTNDAKNVFIVSFSFFFLFENNFLDERWLKWNQTLIIVYDSFFDGCVAYWSLALEMNTVTQIQIQDKAVCISHSAKRYQSNYLGG